MYGRQVPMPIDIMLADQALIQHTSEYADDLHKRLDKAYQQVREQMDHQGLIGIG